MLHLDEGTLHALVDGEIPSSDLAPIRDHLASCAACRAALEETRALAGEALDLVESLEVPEASSPHSGGGPRRSPRATALPWHRLAWAATVVVAVGLGYGVRGILPPPTAPTDALTEAAPVDVEASPPAPAGEVEAMQDTGEAKEEQVPRKEPEAAPEPMTKATAADSPTTPIRAAPRVVGDATLDAVSPLFRDVPAAPLPTRQARLAESRREAPAANEGVGFRSRFSLSAEENALTLDEAMRWSAGRLRLLPDLVPAGLSRRGDTLQITYLLGTRVVVLEEIFHPDTVLFRFRAPADFPIDSLAALRAHLP